MSRLQRSRLPSGPSRFGYAGSHPNLRTARSASSPIPPFLFRPYSSRGCSERSSDNVSPKPAMVHDAANTGPDPKRSNAAFARCSSPATNIANRTSVMIGKTFHTVLLRFPGLQHQTGSRLQHHRQRMWSKPRPRHSGSIVCSVRPPTHSPGTVCAPPSRRSKGSRLRPMSSASC